MKVSFCSLALSVCLALPIPASAAVVQDVIVEAWNSGAVWTSYIDHTQSNDYAGSASDSYAGSTWTTTWNIDSSAGTLRSTQTVTRPFGSTASTVCQSRVSLSDVFHVGAGTSGLAIGTPVTIHLIGQFSGFTFDEAPLYTNGSTNAALYLTGTNNSMLVDIGKAQNCYTAGGPATLPFTQSFDFTLETTVGANLPLSMGIGPSGRYANPGTQTSGCDVQGKSVGFDITAQWGLTTNVSGLDLYSDGGWQSVPEPATAGLIALGICAFAARRRR